ncbi:MAG: hypothetical protein JNM79_22970 [Burkholderiales bacterium]|nr:hypothetical protein [Burkholderiales bacterium]
MTRQRSPHGRVGARALALMLLGALVVPGFLAYQTDSLQFGFAQLLAFCGAW